MAMDWRSIDCGVDNIFLSEKRNRGFFVHDNGWKITGAQF